KYYPVDTGLRRLIVTRTGSDWGKMIECAAFLALRRHFDAVSYWRERGEVDFVVQKGSQITPIQVTWNAPEPRHHAALESFYERFPQAQEAQLISATTFETDLAHQI
nr:DUF4143 domain-containing protein [Myxococcota bacterium]